MNVRGQGSQPASRFLIDWINRIVAQAQSPQHRDPYHRAPYHRQVGIASALICMLVSISIVAAMSTATAQEAGAAEVPTPVPGAAGRALQIVGGQPAEPGEWPWQALVRAGPYLCGGTLIQQEWVMTAAHCVMGPDQTVYMPAEIHVVLGEHDRTKADGTEQEFDIIQVIPHPEYNGVSSDNDIALLHLATPAQVGNGVGIILPIITPTDDTLVAEGTQAMVTGWGMTREGGTIATKLMEVSTPIITNATCNLAYNVITDNMLCAGYAAGGKDACQGDSGGPLVVPTRAGGWKVAGIVSFGYGCARANFYGVYTRVARYVPWLEQSIGNSLSSLPETTEPGGTGTSPIDDTAILSTSATILPDQAMTFTITTTNSTTLRWEIPAATVDEATVLHYRAIEINPVQPSAIRVSNLAFTLKASRNGFPLDQLTFNQAITLTIDYPATAFSPDDGNPTLFALQPADKKWSAQGIPVYAEIPAVDRLVVMIAQTGEYALGTPNRLVFLPLIAR